MAFVVALRKPQIEIESRLGGEIGFVSGFLLWARRMSCGARDPVASFFREVDHDGRPGLVIHTDTHSASTITGRAARNDVKLGGFQKF